MAETASWLPAATAGITALAALGGQFIAGQFQRRNQELAEHRQRREQAGELLADVIALHEDSYPNLLDGDDARQDLDALWERRNRIRIPLLKLATVHPSARVRELARIVEVYILGTLGELERSLGEQGDGRAHRLRAAKELHERVSANLDELVNAIQQE
jgi:hypothetical protein